MIFRYILLAVLIIFAVREDIMFYRISNLSVLLGAASGLVLNSMLCGVRGFTGSLLAAIIPAALLIILFALRMLGAGDIKLFCAIGAIMGIRFILFAMAFSFLAGGIIAVFIMLLRKNLRQRFSYIFAYIKTSFLTQTFIPYTSFADKGDGAKFHFSLAIAAGCCIQIILTAFRS